MNSKLIGLAKMKHGNFWLTSFQIKNLNSKRLFILSVMKYTYKVKVSIISHWKILFPCSNLTQRKIDQYQFLILEEWSGTIMITCNLNLKCVLYKWCFRSINSKGQKNSWVIFNIIQPLFMLKRFRKQYQNYLKSLR